MALGIDHGVKEYPDAGHAFLNDHENAGDRDPFIFVVMGRLPGGSCLLDVTREGGQENQGEHEGRSRRHGRDEREHQAAGDGGDAP